MIQFIAFIICAAGAIGHWYLGNMEWVAIEGVLALINLLAFIFMNRK